MHSFQAHRHSFIYASINIQGQPGSYNLFRKCSKLTTVVSIVGGTMFLMWLGEQITTRGIGNGTSLIIFAGIVAGIAEMPSQKL